MTEQEYRNFRKLSYEDKVFIVSGMDNYKLKKLKEFIKNDAENQCYFCKYWRQTPAHSYGICINDNSNRYQKKTYGCHICYGKEKEDIILLIEILIEKNNLSTAS